MIRADGNTGATPRHLTRSPFSTVQYKVLTIDKLSKDERELVRAKTKTLTTGTEAIAAIGDGWTYEVVDRMGRVGILKRNGVEVALFVQRQVSTMERGVGDPAPESVLTEPRDAWQRFDLMGPSARKANFFVKREVEDKTEKVQLLQQRVENLEGLASHWESVASRKQSAIDGLNEKIEKLWTRFDPDDKIIVRKKGYRYLTEVQAKKIRAAVAKKKRKAKKP